MKIIFYLLLAFSGFESFSQSYTLNFEYDTAGNQKKRELVCVNCRTANNSSDKQQEIENILDLNGLSYYPNPVLEELHIKWKKKENIHLKELYVYSITGQQVISLKDMKEMNQTTIGFRNLAEGLYTVVLVYNNNEKNTFKIIKK